MGPLPAEIRHRQTLESKCTAGRRRPRWVGAVLGLVLLVLGGWCLGPEAAWALELTAEEQRYLAQHPVIRMCVDPDWVPFERIDGEGRHEGIAADLIRLATQRVGVSLELLPTASWDESLAASREGRCQVLSFLNQTPEREAWLVFTEPIFNDANVFITREEHEFIADPASLSDETIVFPRGTSMEERVRRDYPNLTVITVDSEMQAMNLVSTRKADLTMRSLIVAAYTIKKEGLFNLKIAGKLPDYANRLRMGVLKKDAILRDILNKGIGSISNRERNRVVNNHVSIKVQVGVDHDLVWKLLALCAMLVLVGSYWVYKLKRHNEELARVSGTDALTGLCNRSRLNTALDHEITRARRYGHPLSIAILDLDWFKRVNDEFGHLAGDQVLRSVARTARTCVRSCDLLGRWGGEEFLLICPETALAEAAGVAQRIADAVRLGVGQGGGKPQTISGGVATLEPDDSADTLLRKADTALYQAKHGGRDRICAPVSPAPPAARDAGLEP